MDFTLEKKQKKVKEKLLKAIQNPEYYLLDLEEDYADDNEHNDDYENVDNDY